MMTDPLKDLVEVTEALYRAELLKMHAITARENCLRKDLRDLDEHNRSTRSIPDSQLNGLRQIGADVLWQGWVARTRRNLNVELAQILVQKERMKAELQRAFGKQLAASRLLQEDQQAKVKVQEKKFWQDLDDLKHSRSPKI